MTDTTPGVRDDPIAIALALLNLRWPTTAALDDCNGVGTMTGLAADTRYLIGRLHQGLITLLANDLPPMDSRRRCCPRRSRMLSPGASTTASTVGSRCARHVTPTGTKPTATTTSP
jgi:hypothetical protein